MKTLLWLMLCLVTPWSLPVQAETRLVKVVDTTCWWTIDDEKRYRIDTVDAWAIVECPKPHKSYHLLAQETARCVGCKTCVDTVIVYDTMWMPCPEINALGKHIRTLLEHLHKWDKFWITPCSYGVALTSGESAWYEPGDTVWSEPWCGLADSISIGLYWHEAEESKSPAGEKCRLCGKVRERRK